MPSRILRSQGTTGNLMTADDSDLVKLALTTARLLRAHINESLGTYSSEDVAALDEALLPWESPGPPGADEAQPEPK